MSKNNYFVIKHNRFWGAKIASLLLSVGLCVGLLGQSQTAQAEASQPQTEEQSNQQSTSKNDTCSSFSNQSGQTQTPAPSSPNISSSKKDFTNQFPNKDQGVAASCPNNNYHLTNSPSAPAFSAGKVANPNNPVLMGKAPNIDLDEQNADAGNIAASAEKQKIKSDTTNRQKEATETTNKAKNNSSKQSQKNKHQKVYYANIFQTKETNSETKKTERHQQKKTISGLTADVVNKKGQKVGYVDKHDRVHLEKLAYSGKMDSPSLTIGLVAVLAAGLLTSIGFTSEKKRI